MQDFLDLFVFLWEGGREQLLILAAQIRVRVAFISSYLQIHEEGKGPGGGRSVLRKTINFNRPYVFI